MTVIENYWRLREYQVGIQLSGDPNAARLLQHVEYRLVELKKKFPDELKDMY